MPPKRKKFESTFPAARIKKIMQLDDDVGRVASSVPVVISRAVEIFLQAVLTRAGNYAGSRSAKTLTVHHMKHCIEQEKQWDFLKDLTAKIPDLAVAKEEEEENATAPRRGRKRRTSPSQDKPTSSKRKQKSAPTSEKSQSDHESVEENAPEEVVQVKDTPTPTSSESQKPAPSVSLVSPSVSQEAQVQLFPDNGAPNSVSIAALTSSLPKPSSHQDGDEEDYDE